MLSKIREADMTFTVARLVSLFIAAGCFLHVAATTGCITSPTTARKVLQQVEEPLSKPEMEKVGSTLNRSSEFLFLLARELEYKGQLEDSLEAYEAAIKGAPGEKYLLLRAAQVALIIDPKGKAIKLLEKARAADPSDLELRALLGSAYAFAGVPAKAERALTNSENLPVSFDAGEVLYRVLLDRRRIEEAIAVCRFLIQARPKDFRGYHALATIFRSLEDLKGVEGVFLEALEANPLSLVVYGALARLYQEQGKVQSEISVYRKTLGHFPNHVMTLFALAEALLQDGQASEADVLIERLASQDFVGDRLLGRLGFLTFDRGDFRESSEIFVQLYHRDPKNFEAAYYAGLSKARTRDYEDALALFESIPKDEVRYADSKIQCAVVLEKLEEFSLALECIRSAMETSTDRSIEVYFASLLARSGNFTDGLSVLESLLAKEPTDVELLYNIGVLHGEAQLEVGALDYMNQVLAQEPNHPGALNYVGYTWVEKRLNLTEAEDFIRRALEARPEDGFITDSLGWLYYKKATLLLEKGSEEDGGDYLEAAIYELKRAAVLTGGDPVICEHLGDAYLLQGDRRRALENYQKAIDLVPRKREQPKLLKKYHALSAELLGE